MKNFLLKIWKILHPFLLSIRNIWCFIGIILLILLLTEAGFKVVRKIMYKSFSHSEAFKGEKWIDDGFTELMNAFIFDWKPFVYWRTREFHGKYVNIDSDGFRKTAGTDSNKKNKQINIYFFGGSIAWGLGSRDDYTIASCLAKRLSSEGINVEVKNFAQPAYVSTQQIIALMLELRNGNVPGYVIFYNGITDMSATYLHAMPGASFGEDTRIKEFNISKPIDNFDKCLPFFKEICGKSYTKRAVLELKTILGGSMPVSPMAEDKVLLKDTALKLADIYAGNVKILDALSRSFNFRYFACWQPILFSKKNLSAYEKSSIEKYTRRYPGYVEFCREVDNDISVSEYLKKNKRFLYMSNLFDPYKNTFFMDDCHMNEHANDIVAQRLAEEIIQDIARTSCLLRIKQPSERRNR